MNSRTPELSRLTLMCSDHEVAEFTWNHDRQAVTGKTHVLDAAHAPLMAIDPSGNITRDRLSSWFKNRGIPDFRPDAADRLRAVGYPSAASLMASGFGASLSDQYWIRPAGSASTWRDVNCFENDFSEELGELLLPHDASSVPSLIAQIKGVATPEDIRSALRLVGLDADEKKKFRAYSLGMKQRLGIAAAIMEKPKLLVLDEPTNALDEAGVEMLKRVVAMAASTGREVILSSHDGEVLEELADRVYCMRDGVVVKVRERS